MQEVEPDRMVAATAAAAGGAASGGNVAAAAVGAGQRWWRWSAGSRWAERVERVHGARGGVGDRWRIQPPPPLLSINPSPSRFRILPGHAILTALFGTIFPTSCG